MRRILFVSITALTLAACNASVAPLGAAETPAPSLAPSLASAATSAGPSATTSAAPIATPSPSPAVAPTQLLIALPKTFKSPLYRYTIGIGVNWQVKAAKHVDDEDLISATGTDTTIPVLVSALGSKSFTDWLKDYHKAVLNDPGVPPGCDGGDPSTWPAVTIGNQQGVWLQKCNAAVAFVDVGGKAYQFPWENGTFDNSQHLSLADFKTVLGTVTFP
jgi:hypothetical protein